MTEDNRRKTAREKRLAEELRRNLARRKVQSRARRQGEADGREDGIEASAPPDPKLPQS